MHSAPDQASFLEAPLNGNAYPDAYPNGQQHAAALQQDYQRPRQPLPYR